MVRLAIIAVFFFSGAAGLVYEIVWMRSLSLIFGVTTYAVATVLATFMGGLALGSYLFGGLADDRRRSPLLVYAALEAGVGIYALFVPTLFQALRVAYIALAHLEPPYALLALGRASMAAAVLLPPSALMGGTFPILVRFLVRSRSDVGRTAGLLYFINTAGALFGCLGAGFVFIERLGLVGTTRLAAATSLAAAAAAALLARRAGASAPADEPSAGWSPSAGDEPAGGAVRIALACIAVSGFTSLAYEVLWTRALLRHTFNSTYAFTTILATFLGGIALGSALHAALLRGRRNALLLFAALEVAIGLGFAASAALFPGLPALAVFVRRSDVIASFAGSILMMFCYAALILLGPAVFLGATVPLATEICARGLARLGGTVGRVYAVNTLGAILGSLGAGFVLIPYLGMYRSLVALIGTNLLLGLLLMLKGTSRASRLRFGAAGAVVGAWIAVAVLVPSDLFRRNFAPRGQKIIFYREGVTDTVAVVEGLGQRTIAYEDRRGTAGTNSYGLNFLLGHLPMLLHPGEPRTVLHICFGVGNSLSAVAAHDSLVRVDNVELSPHVLDAAHYFWTNDDVIDNPKVRTIIDDGRNFVMAARERYDVILLEPPQTYSAGVINLYTREFYEDSAARLAPDGVMLQWIPYAEAPLDEERMLFRAFYDVFPEATAWRLREGGPILFIGTKRPLRIDYQRLRERITHGRVGEDMKLIKLDDVDHLLALFLFDSKAFRDFSLPAAPVTEDRTVLDFSMPRYVGSGYGFAPFTGFVNFGDHLPLHAIAERTRWYFDHRSSVVPLLFNLGGEDPAAIQARIDARATPEGEKMPWIPENKWRRWE
jgi:spermidine synthase